MLNNIGHYYICFHFNLRFSLHVTFIFKIMSDATKSKDKKKKFSFSRCFQRFNLNLKDGTLNCGTDCVKGKCDSNEWRPWLDEKYAMRKFMMVYLMFMYLKGVTNCSCTDL